MGRHLGHRNFGLGNRNMALAGKNALKEGGYSFKSIETNAGHFRQFILYVKNEHQDVKDLKHIERHHVIAYANYLKDQYNQGRLASSSAQNRLSAINTVMFIARQDKQCHVSPIREGGLATRTFVATESKCVSGSEHEMAKSQVGERLAVMLDLQRAFGLRFKESALFNAQQALRQSNNNGMIRVEHGTKGGRPREIPVLHQAQREILQQAAELQGRHTSLVPKTQSLKEFTQHAYLSLQKTSLSGFHGERHTYANTRYEELTGQKSPVEANISHGRAHLAYLSNQLGISRVNAAALDRAARIAISHELGHSRIAITNNYLG